MAEPTTTRKTLRRAIARAEHLQFFQKYEGDELTLATDSGATYLHSTSLVQADDFWNNGWAYVLSTGDNYERRITDFHAAGDACILEYPLPIMPNTGQKLEIYDLYSPTNIHAKINEAIERAARFFPDTVVDTSFVLEKDKLRYSLTGLTKRVHRLQRVQIERINNSCQGEVDSVTVNGVNLEIHDASLFTVNDQYNGWRIAFYDGTGSGSIGTIDDTVSTGYVVVTTADLTASPAQGSLFRIFDPSYQTIDLVDVNYRYVDTLEYPDTLYLEGNLPTFYGYRLYLYYTSLPTALTTDAATTTVPAGLIIARARALLHEDLMNTNRADTQRHNTLAQYFHAQADAYTSQAYPQRPTQQQTYQGNVGTASAELDPLEWRG